MRLAEAKIYLIGGKGGTGKTTVSRALARHLSSGRKGSKPALWICFDDPVLAPGLLIPDKAGFQQLNLTASFAFENYVAEKVGGGRLTQLFLQNKVVQTLSRAAPGLSEFVLAHELLTRIKAHSKIVVDMPSTGYELTFFQSLKNICQLMKSGPIARDAQHALEIFADPKICQHLIIGLPEEMPIRESLDLREAMQVFFPKNKASIWINRCLNTSPDLSKPQAPLAASQACIAANLSEFLEARSQLEARNLALLNEEQKQQPLLLPLTAAQVTGSTHVEAQLCLHLGAAS